MATQKMLAFTIDLAGSNRGLAMGIFTALVDLGAGMGAVIMGVILQLTNYTVMFLCLALTGVINFFYFYFAVRKRPQEITLPVREGLLGRE